MNKASKKLPIKARLNTKILWIVVIAGLSCCSSSPLIEDEAPTVQSTSASINELIQLANNSEGRSSARARLAAITLLFQENDIDGAQEQFDRVDYLPAMRDETTIQLDLIGARLALADAATEEALRLLLRYAPPLETPYYSQYVSLLTHVYLSLNRPIEAFSLLSESAEVSNTNSTNSQNLIWQSLSMVSATELDAIAASASNYEARGWIELARTTNSQQSNIKAQLDAIEQWQRIWSSHSAANNLPDALIRLQEIWELRPKQIALILPLQEPAGIAIQEGFLGAYFESMTATFDAPTVNFYDSSAASTIYPLYDQAVEDGAELIIGPLDKALVNQLQRLPELPIPTLALNYADTETGLPNSYFYQFGLAPEDEIIQAVDLAAAAGFVNAAIITPDGDSYTRLSNTFKSAWAEVGGSLVSQTIFDSESNYADVIKELMAIDASESRADKIKELLPRNSVEFIPRRRQDIDFIYLIANPRQGRQIKPTLAFYFAENLPVLAYPSIYDGSTDSETNRDLDGVIILDAPWLLTDNDFKSNVSSQLRPASGPLQRLRALGVDSYRLHARLGQLQGNEISRLSGVTGLLTMTEQQKIVRRLNLAVFSEGLPSLTETLEINKE